MKIKKNLSNKGFTLAELLIVVAIIAVLVAISIPIFTSQLEKSREAADLANVRGAYAEVSSAALLEDKSDSCYKDDVWSIVVDLKQSQDGWATKTPIKIGSVTSGSDGGTNSDETWIGKPAGHGTCTVSCDKDGKVIFNWAGGETPDAGPAVPEEPGESEVEKTPIEKIKEAAVDFPQSNFNATAGDIFLYNGKYYVCNTTQEYQAGGSPDNWYQWQFINMSDGEVLTNADMTNPWGGNTYVFTHVERGTIYTDGTDYYIRNQTSDNAGTPSTDSGNWTKINQ